MGVMLKCRLFWFMCSWVCLVWVCMLKLGLWWFSSCRNWLCRVVGVGLVVVVMVGVVVMGVIIVGVGVVVMVVGVGIGVCSMKYVVVFVIIRLVILRLVNSGFWLDVVGVGGVGEVVGGGGWMSVVIWLGVGVVSLFRFRLVWKLFMEVVCSLGIICRVWFMVFSRWLL